MPVRGVVTRWKPVSKTITGEPVKIIAYQLIIEKDVEPHRHMIGKLGLNMSLACTPLADPLQAGPPESGGPAGSTK